MFRYVIGSIIFLALHPVLQGQAVKYPLATGNSWMNFCGHSNTKVSKQDVFEVECLSYVEGIDAAETIARHEFSKAGIQDPRRFKFCRGESVTVGQEKDIVTQFIVEHPQVRDVDLALNVYGALMKAFPCK